MRCSAMILCPVRPVVSWEVREVGLDRQEADPGVQDRQEAGICVQSPRGGVRDRPVGADRSPRRGCEG